MASAEGGASGDRAAGGRLQAGPRGEIRVFLDAIGAAASYRVGTEHHAGEAGPQQLDSGVGASFWLYRVCMYVYENSGRMFGNLG